ncbi:MAG: hypothetical protein ABI629_06715 [bacterium]
MSTLDLAPGRQHVIVFSHPNHELAVFGLLQRLRPQLVYLTDGGGAARVGETCLGLERIGLRQQAHFLNFSEQSLYDALLAGDIGFYRDIAARVGERFEALKPQQVFCDAVEFYNPLHDMSLPIVFAALRDRAAAVFEVPLVHQRAGAVEAYDVQRMPPSRRAGEVEMPLSERELAAKLAARAQGYALLQAQMGPVLAGLPQAHLAIEVVAPAPPELPAPGPDCVLRYEWRAQRLLARGEIGQAITYADHFLPLAASLVGQA